MNQTFKQFIMRHYGTVTQFSRDMDVSYNTAKSYVNEAVGIRMNIVKKIADQTGTPISEIIEKLKAK